MREFPGFKKGLNLGGWLSQSPLTKEHMDSFITEEDIKVIASMGADHVRLPVDYPLVETEAGTVKEEGYSYIDNCVAWCEKHGLHVLLDLHRAYGYSFGNAANCGSFFENADLQERFITLWEMFAMRYGKYGFVAFDLLNEIVDPNVSDAWNDLAERTVYRIRKFAPDTWIVIGGTCYNSINTVKYILPPPDDKIAYSFHFYEPFLFTHQGASWEKLMPNEFRVGYPLTAGEYIDIANHELNGNFSGIFRGMSPETNGTGMIDFIFQEAVSVAEKQNVPLYCGEYGVIHNAAPEYNLAWKKDMYTVFEKYGIGRAVWSYKRMGFGIVDEHCKNVYEELIKVL